MTEHADRVCADCGLALSEDETWVCSDCCTFYAIFKDPNGDMSGDDNEPSST